MYMWKKIKRVLTGLWAEFNLVTIVCKFYFFSRVVSIRNDYANKGNDIEGKTRKLVTSCNENCVCNEIVSHQKLLCPFLYMFICIQTIDQ